MLSVFQIFLFLHIFAAIVAFGSIFVFPLIAGMAEGEPMHGNFALRLTEKVEDRLVIPVAITMPISGTVMIISGSISLAHFWLLAGITLYVIAMLFAILVQRQTVIKMVHLTSGMMAGAAAGPGAASAGPPPEFVALQRRARLGGMFLTLLLILIVILMVFRPGS